MIGRNPLAPVLFFLIVLVVLAPVAFAAEAISGDDIRLDDGSIAHLRGVKAVFPNAKTDLQNLIDRKNLTLDNSVTDRYGRTSADIYAVAEDGTKSWLQGVVLSDGNAFVYPPLGDEPRLADLFKAEHQARQDKKGLWADSSYADLAADKPDDILYGHYAFVAGTVAKAERIKNKFYLNFGADWRDDFTIAIATHDLTHFRRAKIDPASYQGKKVRVRGWVKRDFGPMITVNDPAQIEVLGENVQKP